MRVREWLLLHGIFPFRFLEATLGVPAPTTQKAVIRKVENWDPCLFCTPGAWHRVYFPFVSPNASKAPILRIPLENVAALHSKARY